MREYDFGDEELNLIIDHIQKVMESLFNISVTVSISGICSGYSSLGRMYESCISAFELKFFIGIGKKIQCNEKLDENQCLQIFQQIKEIPSMLARENIINENSAKKLEFTIEQYKHSDLRIRDEIIKLLLQLMLSGVPKLDQVKTDITSMLIKHEERIKNCETLNEAIKYLKEYISEITGENKNLSRDIAKAAYYIRENMHQEISLQKAAEYVNLSPNYLSSLLKKELGLSFVEYLNQMRIDEASRLLIETDMKSYEISEKVGFTDDSYFSRAFKRITGYRPNEFRKQRIYKRTECPNNDVC